MRMIVKLIVVFLMLAAGVGSCKPQPKDAPKPVTREEQVLIDLVRLKKMAATGDLIVRLGDDALSYQIKNMNDVEKDYSHAGLIVEKNGSKMVAHIAPEENNMDVIQYLSIDSFLIPGKNIAAALYRYNFSDVEKASVEATIDSLKASGLHFDRMYELSTNNKMYCSEMIGKAIRLATHGRIVCKEVDIPPHMLPLLETYFKGKATRKVIAARKIMTIDNLYLIPECSLLMKFRLKYFPGE